MLTIFLEVNARGDPNLHVHPEKNKTHENQTSKHFKVTYMVT